MKSPAARHMGVPTVPLTDLYNSAGDYIRARGGVLHFRSPFETFRVDASRIQLRLRNQEGNLQSDSKESRNAHPASPERLAGQVDLTIWSSRCPSMRSTAFSPNLPRARPSASKSTHFENSPITGIHLWFDRQISDLDHAVLLDRTIQWMFHKSRLQHHGAAERVERAALQGRVNAKKRPGFSPLQSGSYIELVVSSSKTLIDKSRAEIVDLALTEVREFFPAAREANLVKSTVIKEVNATYSPRPASTPIVQPPATAWPRVFLAGDWTATGWPATMEGAVRSGYLAAEALARAAGFKDSALPLSRPPRQRAYAPVLSSQLLNRVDPGL